MQVKKQDGLGEWFGLAAIYPIVIGTVMMFLSRITLSETVNGMLIAGMLAPTIQLRIGLTDKLNKSHKIFLTFFSVFCFIGPIILIVGSLLRWE